MNLGVMEPGYKKNLVQANAHVKHLENLAIEWIDANDIMQMSSTGKTS